MVASELSGRVVEVMVEKGDHVTTGDPLFRLDGELLNSQRERAVRALEAAQANLESAQTGLEMSQATLNVAEANYEAALANSQAELTPVEQAFDELFDNADVIKAQAEGEVAAANRALREAQYMLDNFTVPTEQQSMTALEGVVVMEARLAEARQAFEPYKYRSSSDPTREEYKEALDEAQSDYDSAVRRLEYETAVERARQGLDKALRNLDAVQDGPDPDDVAKLQARIAAIEAVPRQVETAVEQARVGVVQAQAVQEAASRAVTQAQAELDLIDVQINKLLITAAGSGVVLSRNLEAGEVIQAGAPAMVVGDLDRLTITVYVPEDRYGRLNLGGSAQVNVDSFPGDVFDATVVYIADKAEFTPRNVQTAEGRRTTVFAVELAVDDPNDKLKPGMPADVQFQE
jgi:multidrug resistance efflux pump